MCDCTLEEKTIFFSFYSKWLLWKPATPFWGFNWKQWYQRRQQFLLLAKTIFDFKQAHRASFIFFLWTALNFWLLTPVFCAFYRLYPEITCFCNKPSWQIFFCHVTRPIQILLGNFSATFRILSNFFVREQLLATFWKTFTFLVTFRLFNLFWTKKSPGNKVGAADCV